MPLSCSIFRFLKDSGRKERARDVREKSSRKIMTRAKGAKEKIRPSLRSWRLPVRVRTQTGLGARKWVRKASHGISVCDLRKQGSDRLDHAQPAGGDERDESGDGRRDRERLPLGRGR